ncbi:hypothetical protein QQM39_21165 [Streptomyces sp. DT2A-34]|uniref:hypothetical protein n=1 Tax=Streptomyces sp. DT2A-34 TaxID=3051182 RepID=UPI00265BDCF5|nr:hypothetical protein [Streptomyces sp. DT2A-34]MDO0913263.1 hypothetical protein [Streptomyces sp. DT2A-34]
MTEAGVPVVIGLLARVNPLVLTTMGASAVAHGATALYDVSLATGRREIHPVEQDIRQAHGTDKGDKGDKGGGGGGEVPPDQRSEHPG